ncbi:MAG: macro domain-containing protein [Candidatus Omnitrophica bacterium]|nr:macro domain-containing protein [Candidatus Omnitrophota bacterium]MCB9747349.1 macro domain-containing protein [Candidatus Omnitrophota bacterium]
MKIKNTEIKIIQDDITQLKVDAIVNSANPSLKMEEGLAGVIKAKAGRDFEEEVKNNAPVEIGQAVWTKAGLLNCKFVIHAVSVNKDKKTDQSYIRKATASALRAAHQINASSLAIPALGCGIGDFPAKGAAKIITQEILKFLKSVKATPIREIILCLFEKDVFQEFDETVRGYIHHIQENLGPGPYVTVDIIIERDDGIVLIERSNPPYGWALPGGFLDYGESLEEAAVREAREETSLDLEDLQQFHTYSDPDRDPRFQTISTVFTARGEGSPKFGDDAKGLKIVPYKDLLKLDYAFDHKLIMKEYLESRK